ncbi:MAG: hypothetical protein U9R15_11620 [Chloroflexota bacterium]|nr:hypothetical protein [Chloroflexota bacterium]
MAKVKFIDIKIGQVYVTRGGTAVINRAGKTVGWGYDRIRVIKKTSTKLIVETPWGTSCILPDDYLLYSTREIEPRIEFKLITNYISKQEISFDDAIKQSICIEDIPPEDMAAEQFSIDLIEYFSTPQLVSAAARKFNVPYQKIRYLIDKIENIDNYKVNRINAPEGKTVHITKYRGKNGKRT